MRLITRDSFILPGRCLKESGLRSSFPESVICARIVSMRGTVRHGMGISSLLKGSRKLLPFFLRVVDLIFVQEYTYTKSGVRFKINLM